MQRGILEQTAGDCCGNHLIPIVILCFIITYFAWKKKFYTFPSLSFCQNFLPFVYPLVAFLLYFLGMVILGPLIYWAMKITPLKAYTLSLTQAFTLLALFSLFIFYLKIMRQDIRHFIFSGNTYSSIFFQFWKNLYFGSFSWIVAYPVVLLVNFLTQQIALKIWGIKGVQQISVEMLRSTAKTYWLFGLLTVVIIFIVPFIEELIFRGFLQTYLRQYLGRWGALISTALIFSLFHYSSKQGLGNIELIVSLFVLSLYLGFLYERQKSLWASYGLHMTFNALSIATLLYQLVEESDFV